MKKAYIAGKITNDPDYREKFAYVVEHLKRRGYAVMSPAIMPDGFEYEDYMHVCFAMMHVCRTGTAFFLPNYLDSPGAIREHDNAVELGMKIEYLTWSQMEYPKHETVEVGVVPVDTKMIHAYILRNFNIDDMQKIALHLLGDECQKCKSSKSEVVA